MIALTLLGLSLVVAGGCAHAPVIPPQSNDPFALLTYGAVDQMMGSSLQRLDPEAPILVATVVNVNDLEKSSALGRMVTEHVSGRLTQHGFYVRELNLRSGVGMKPQSGELLLSRDLRDVADRHDAQAVVVGTYAVGKPWVYARSIHVSLRLLSLEQARGLAAVDYAIPMGRDARSLITVSD